MGGHSSYWCRARRMCLTAALRESTTLGRSSKWKNKQELKAVIKKVVISAWKR